MRHRVIALLAGVLVAAWWSPLGSQTQVANNAAELAGKIIMLADGGTARTVTGSFTFDRDPSAPFAVTASSAVVTNLDADLLDGSTSALFALLADNETVSGAWVFSNALMDLTHASSVLRLSGTTGPRIFVGDTANANMGAGLTLNQGTADDQIVALKSSDVATGLTTGTVAFDVETDDFFTISKRLGANGGVTLQVLSESTVGAAFIVDAYAGAPDTTDTSASTGQMQYFVGQHNDANALADMAVNSNAIVWGEIDSLGARLVRMLLKADDGELHLGNTTLVALDAEDDIRAVRALQRLRTDDDGIILTPYDARVPYDYQQLRALGVVGARDAQGDFLIRVQPYLNLHDGAIWQLHVNHQRLTADVERLRAQLTVLERQVASLPPQTPLR